MARTYIVLAMMLMLGTGVRQAHALGEVIEVTRQTQAKLGLGFTLTAERVSEQVVLVEMDIPKAGKLKDLRSVTMRIGLEGTPMVDARLHTREGRGGSVAVSFQLTSELADRCAIDLQTPFEPPMRLSYLVYAVELKGYVTDRKGPQPSAQAPAQSDSVRNRLGRLAGRGTVVAAGPFATAAPDGSNAACRILPCVGTARTSATCATGPSTRRVRERACS